MLKLHLDFGICWHDSYSSVALRYRGVFASDTGAFKLPYLVGFVEMRDGSVLRGRGCFLPRQFRYSILIQRSQALPDGSRKTESMFGGTTKALVHRCVILVFLGVRSTSAGRDTTPPLLCSKLVRSWLVDRTMLSRLLSRRRCMEAPCKWVGWSVVQKILPPSITSFFVPRQSRAYAPRDSKTLSSAPAFCRGKG